MPQYDTAVIGAGIVGLATARALLLSEPDRRVIVLEKETGVAKHQTGNNSGVIHAGLYYKPGSKKALLCTAGRDALYEFCAEHEVDHENCGKLVVATRESQIPALDELERRGNANGIVGIRRLDATSAKEYEPHVRAVAALHVPVTGIVDYVGMSQKIRDDIRRRGGVVMSRFRVGEIERSGVEGLRIRATNASSSDVSTVRAKSLINCGGLESDRIARLAGFEPGVVIVPFRGEYYRLADYRTSLVKNLIYPVPNPSLPFLGVHFTRMISGGVEAGPNAVFSFKREGYTKTSFSARDTWSSIRYSGFWKLAARFWKTGIAEFARSASKARFVNSLQELIPEVRESDVVPYGAGVRAQAVGRNGRLVDDFHIVRDENQIHVLNAPSPAATASLAIGREIARMHDEGAPAVLQSN